MLLLLRYVFCLFNWVYMGVKPELQLVKCGWGEKCVEREGDGVRGNRWWGHYWTRERCKGVESTQRPNTFWPFEQDLFREMFSKDMHCCHSYLVYTMLYMKGETIHYVWGCFSTSGFLPWWDWSWKLSKLGIKKIQNIHHKNDFWENG